MMTEKNPFTAPTEVEEDTRVSVLSTGIPREVVPRTLAVTDVLRFSHRVFLRNMKKCLLGTFLAILPACVFAGLGPLLYWLFAWGTTTTFPVDATLGDRIPVERLAVQGDIFWGPLGGIFITVSVLGVLMAFWILAGTQRYFTRLVRTGHADYQDIYLATLGEMFRTVMYLGGVCLLILCGAAVFFLQNLQGRPWMQLLFRPRQWSMEFWIETAVYTAVILLLFLPGFWLLVTRRMTFPQTLYYSVAMAARNAVQVLLLGLTYTVFFVLATGLTGGIMVIFALPYLIIFYTVSCILASGEQLTFFAESGAN